MARRLIAPFLLALAALVYLLLTEPTKAQEAGPAVNPYAAMAEQMLLPTVQIGQTVLNQQSRFCSGSIFHSDRDELTGEVTTLVLTAKHCVDVNANYDVLVPEVGDDLSVVSTTSYAGVAAGVCAGQDVAYIRLDDTETIYPTVALADADTQLYEIEPVWLVGYPKGLSRTVTTGALGILENDPSGGTAADLIRSATSIYGGNSGGPLFHQTADGTFEQIAIGVAVWGDALHMAYSVPLRPLSKCVEDFLGREERRIVRLQAERTAP